MHIRPMTRADLPACATVSAAASIEDPLFVHLCPKRHEHPDHFWSFMLEIVKTQFIAKGAWGIVCVTDADDVGHEVEDREDVIGYAIWYRSPATMRSFAEQAWIPTNESWACAVERGLTSFSRGVRDAILPNANLAADAKRWREFCDTMIKSNPFKPLKYGYWELQILAVLPEQQHQGIGGALLQWGLDHATRERVPAVLMASPIGRKLYDSRGFKVIDAVLVPGMEHSDPAMIWNPRKQWARDLKEGDHKVTKHGLQMEAVWTDKAKAGLDEQERARLPGYEYIRD